MNKFIGSDNKTDVSVKLEILDILCNLILRFGRTYSLNFEEVIFYEAF